MKIIIFIILLFSCTKELNDGLLVGASYIEGTYLVNHQELKFIVREDRQDRGRLIVYDLETGDRNNCGLYFFSGLGQRDTIVLVNKLLKPRVQKGSLKRKGDKDYLFQDSIIFKRQ